jgi:hypothetical protein
LSVRFYLFDVLSPVHSFVFVTSSSPSLPRFPSFAGADVSKLKAAFDELK